MFVYGHKHMSIDAHWGQRYQDTFGVGVTGSYELPEVDAGNWTHILYKRSACSSPLSYLLSQRLLFLKQKQILSLICLVSFLSFFFFREVMLERWASASEHRLTFGTLRFHFLHLPGGSQQRIQGPHLAFASTAHTWCGCTFRQNTRNT